MPHTRPHRWISFLLLIAVFALGVCATLVFQRNRIGGELTPTEERIVSASLTLSALAGGFAAQAALAKKAARTVAEDTKEAVRETRKDIRHDVRNELQPVQLKLEQVPQQVVNTINGGMDKAADKAAAKALDASPFPTTHEQLASFVREVRSADCERIVDRALERAYPKMLEAARASGWQAPPETPRVQT